MPWKSWLPLSLTPLHSLFGFLAETLKKGGRYVSGPPPQPLFNGVLFRRYVYVGMHMVRQIFPKSFLSLLPPSKIPGSIPFSSSHFYQRQLALGANPPPKKKKTISAFGRLEIGASPSRGCLLIAFRANGPFFCVAACVRGSVCCCLFANFNPPAPFCLPGWRKRGKKFLFCADGRNLTRRGKELLCTLP